MKKILIIAALLGSVSFASEAATTTTTTTPLVSKVLANELVTTNEAVFDAYYYHFTHCGADVYAVGGSEAEMWEVVDVLVDVYCG